MSETNTILIVDDEPFAIQTLEGMLRRENYHLIFANDGQEALAQLKRNPVDVILSDVMMPEMDGFELCRLLKQHRKWKHIPIILVTALDSKKDLALGFEAGADDFLNKPVRGVELRARVSSMLRIKKQHDELQGALNLREELADMIVHDLKNPLTSIMFGISLLKRSMPEIESLRGHAEKIGDHAQRLNKLIDELLLLAKIKSDKLIVHATEVDLKEWLPPIMEQHRLLAEAKKMTLHLEIPEDSARYVRIDKNLMERTLENLISNAIKYSDPEKPITVNVENDRDSEEGLGHLRISVRDQGFGIPEHFRERIFNKFEIAELRQKGVSQTGIGLAYTKLVVEAHGGEISVAENYPQGSVFSIVLPHTKTE